MTTFYLVRHGVTDSIGRYLPGTAEGTPLTEAGQRQAEQIGAALRDIPVAAVVASPLTRTRQTAEAIARPHQLEVTVQPAFLEFDVGAWTGAIRHHRPDFNIKMTWRDVAIVLVACVAYITVILPIFLKYKGEM